MRRLMLLALLVPLVSACGRHSDSPESVPRWITVEHQLAVFLEAFRGTA